MGEDATFNLLESMVSGNPVLVLDKCDKHVHHWKNWPLFQLFKPVENCHWAKQVGRLHSYILVILLILENVFIKKFLDLLK